MTKDTGIVNIRGKEYETVALRVQKFRQEHGISLSIITSVVHADETVVRMKAAIVNGEGLNLATGHAEEYRSSSSINKTSALENCETSAIGRALAAFGMAGSEFASADEVARAVGGHKPAAPINKPAMLDAAQQEAIKQAADAAGVDLEVICNAYNAGSMSEIPAVRFTAIMARLKVKKAA